MSTRYEPTWTHGPISGPINGALGAMFFAALGDVADLSMWLPLIIAGIGIGASITIYRIQAYDRCSVVVFRAMCWLAAGCWSSWTIWQGWSVSAVTVILLGALAAGLLSPAFASLPSTIIDIPVEPEIKGLEDDWTALIMKVCGLRDPVTVSKVCDWPHKTGYTLSVEFAPGTPTTWETLRDAQVGLAAARRLPPGCPINAERSTRHQGEALLHVSTVNDLERDIPFPTDYSPLSIIGEFPIGLYLDKQPTMIELHQSSGIIAGKRGGGKTVILQVMTAQLARCVDTVIWHVDLNGGGMSAAWLTPHALEEQKTPTVDWVACTPGEAILVAKVGAAIAKDRKRRYQRLMIERDTDVLPVSANLPAILIIVDEGGEVTGADATRQAQEAASALRELQRIGRAMCVNVVFSVQRATADYVPSQMKKSTSLSIVTKVKDQAEIAHLLDWKRGISVDDLTCAGAAYIQRDGSGARLYKGFRLRPAQICDIARTTESLRPSLDTAAVAVGGKTYAQRWERHDVREFLAGLVGDTITPVEADVEQTGQAAMSTPLRGARNAIERMRALRTKNHDNVTHLGLVMPSETTSTVNEDITVHLSPEPEQTNSSIAPTSVAERRAIMARLIEESGCEGMRTAEIVKAVWAAGITVRRQTVSEWLAVELSAGRVLSPEHGKWIAARYATECRPAAG